MDVNRICDWVIEQQYIKKNRLSDKEKRAKLKMMIEELLPVKKPALVKTKEKRLKDFQEKIAEHKEDYDRDLLVEFYEYWTEISERGRKFRWEREKVFNVGLRLKKFHYNKITSFGRYPERYNDNAKKVNEGRSWNQD